VNCHYERRGLARGICFFRGIKQEQIPRCARDDKEVLWAGIGALRLVASLLAQDDNYKMPLVRATDGVVARMTKRNK